MSSSRILIVHPSTELYGADRMLLASVDALRENAEVAVLLPGHGPIEQELRDRDVLVLHGRLFVLRKSLLRPGAFLRSLPEVLLALFSLKRALKTHPASTIYINTITLPACVIWARVLRRRVVVHVHEADWDAGRSVRTLLTLPLNVADLVIANSRNAARFSASIWSQVSKRVEVMYNGVDRKSPQMPRPLPNTPPGELRLLQLGRWSRIKGTDIAVQAVHELRQRGRVVTLRLVGSVFTGYEPFEQSLRDAVHSLGLDGRVTFDGFCEDPWPCYEGADVVLIPSRRESFGLIAVEAQLSERPVVASAVDGLQEVVHDGSTGFLCRSNDAWALADAIEAAWDNWPRTLDVAREGRATAEQRFSREMYAKALRGALGVSSNAELLDEDAT